MISYEETCLANVKGLMQKNGDSQKVLADIIGCDRSRISKVFSEKDKAFFTIEQLILIAQHYDVSLDYLVGNKTPEKTSFDVADVLQVLFDWDSSGLFKLEWIKGRTGGRGLEFAIYLSDINIQQCLREWTNIKSASFDEETSRSVLSAWKKDQLSKYKGVAFHSEIVKR